MHTNGDNMHPQRRLIAGGALAAVLSLAVGTAQAQDFPPKKPVTMVVGFAAGGSADIAARIMARA
jgi:tripartite-type tricarboxylate transporter receptor subunit TctC